MIETHLIKALCENLPGPGSGGHDECVEPFLRYGCGYSTPRTPRTGTAAGSTFVLAVGSTYMENRLCKGIFFDSYSESRRLDSRWYCMTMREPVS